MTIAEDKVVALSYQLQSEGDVVETKEESSPLKFVFGSGQLLPEFEANIRGKVLGDKFDFSLEPNQAYGEINQNAIVDLAKSIFVVNGELKEDLLQIGNVIPMMDRNGTPLNGKVLEIGDENVKLDFNHPLAGKTLNFSGKITEVRQATDEEIESGYPEGMAPAGGCSCGSSDSCDSHGSGGGCGSGCSCS